MFVIYDVEITLSKTKYTFQLILPFEVSEASKSVQEDISRIFHEKGIPVIGERFGDPATLNITRKSSLIAQHVIAEIKAEVKYNS